MIVSLLDFIEFINPCYFDSWKKYIHVMDYLKKYFKCVFGIRCSNYHTISLI